MADKNYMLEYEEFISSYKRTEVSGEDVGEMVMKMAAHYARYNLKLGDALKEFAAVKVDFQNQMDPVTGKGMSTAKAEILAYATSASNTYSMAKIDVENIENYINALKCLQRGVLFEYSSQS